MAINHNGVGIDGVYSNKDEIGVRLYWNGDLGFGQVDIVQFRKSGVIRIDSESMTREFVKEVLCALVDNAKLEYED